MARSSKKSLKGLRLHSHASSLIFYVSLPPESMRQTIGSEITPKTVNDDADTGKDLLWYFAYGSNINRNVLEKRRRISPADSRCCHVPGYFLSFDMIGMPYVEPCFASALKHDPPNGVVTKEYARTVHDRCAYGTPFHWDPNNPNASLPPTLEGVAHLVTTKQFQRIVSTEGGWGHEDIPTGYSVADIECVTYDGERIRAKTLVTKPASVVVRCQATPRYLNLIRKGAKEHNISPAYQEYLDSLEPFHITSTGKRVGKYIFIITFTPIFVPFIAAVMLANRFNKNIPKLWGWYATYVFRFTRLVHRYLLSPAFGSGQRTSEQSDVKIISRM